MRTIYSDDRVAEYTFCCALISETSFGEAVQRNVAECEDLITSLSLKPKLKFILRNTFIPNISALTK